MNQSTEHITKSIVEDKLTANDCNQLFELVNNRVLKIPDLFAVPATPIKEKLLRTVAPMISEYLSQNIKYRLASVLKKFRNPSGKLNIKYPLDFDECQELESSLNFLNLKPWWGKRAVICLCHDVDNRTGAEFVEEMAQINLDSGLKSTFNFLTNADYFLDHELLQNLKNNNFEIGIHGVTHDQGFAFRNKKIIKSELNKAKESLKPYNPVGYRSPALSLSENLFSSLADSNIKYDSSLQTSSPFYHSVRLPYPVYLSKYNVWELPLTIQDDNYFRDTKTSETNIFQSIQRYIVETIRLNGVLVINMHPHLMVERKEFYREFVRVITAHKEIVCTTMSEVIDYAQSQTTIIKT